MYRAVFIGLVAVLLAGCGSVMTGSSVPGAGSAAPRSPSNLITTSPTPAPTLGPLAGTLYAATLSTVYAFDVTANGTTSPQRTITPRPNQTQVFAGLATSADGTLDILENLFVGPSNNETDYCRVVVESATANGTDAPAGTHLCDPSSAGTPKSIARNTAGGYDVLFVNSADSKLLLRRFNADGAGVSSTLQLDFPAVALATNHNGHDFLVTFNGRIVSYNPATTDPAVRGTDNTLAGAPQTSQIAVSPGADKTVYVVEGPLGNENVYALAPGSSTISRTIGPFTNRYISALTVDSHGNLYLGTNKSGTPSTVQVYGPTASGTPSPDRIIIPSPSITEFRGLAIFE